MFSWFATRSGRIFTYSAVGAVAVSIFGSQVALHGPLLHKYQNIFQMTKHDKPVAMSPDLLAKAENVLSECHLNEKYKKKIRFFAVSGLDVLHAGGYNFPWGAIIGIPPTYSKDAKFVLHDIKLIGRDDVDWVVEGVDLLDALKLSEDAHKFVIAREIYSCDILEVLQRGLIGSLFVYIPSMLIYHGNKRVQALTKYSLKFRVLLYVCMYGFCLFAYKSMKDPLKHFTDALCDKKAAELGPEYLKGGIEYYMKQLEKNRALREIMGQLGERQFTKEGNVNHVLFAPMLPISERLRKLQEMRDLK